MSNRIFLGLGPWLVAVTLAGCGHARLLHPTSWHRSPPPPPPAVVSVLEVHQPAGGAGPVLPQRWQRNTLVIDLRSQAGEGALEISPANGALWPIRLALLVRAGSMGTLEVDGVGRQQFTVPATGADLTYAIAPELYPPGRRSLTLAWHSSAPAP